MKNFTRSMTLLVSTWAASAMSASAASIVVAGWDTWDSATAPTASVAAAGITASAVTTTESNAWNTADGRGSSNDGIWGNATGLTPAASILDADGENLTLPNATTGGTITFTVTNGGASDYILDSFHIDTYAFRPHAPRTYAFSVGSGDLTVGTILTSTEDEITHVGGNWANDAHDDIDISLSGLADHTLAAGESVDFLLAFSDGTGNGAGGHHLFVDNVAVSGAVVPEPSSMTLIGLGGLALVLRRRRR